MSVASSPLSYQLLSLLVVGNYVLLCCFTDLPVQEKHLLCMLLQMNHVYVEIIIYSLTNSKSILDHYLIELQPSSCLSKWAGESERKIKSAFQSAKQHSPSILFLDEFDALAMRRDTVEEPGMRRLLSELLIQINSISFQDRVTIVAATNRLKDLDSAIVRRFQKVIEVQVPTLEERKQMIKYHLHTITHSLSEDDFQYIGEMTEGWSGSLLFVWFIFSIVEYGILVELIVIIRIAAEKLA